MNVAAHPAPEVLVTEHPLTEPERIVLDAIIGAAERGEPCPTNNFLKTCLGYNSQSSVCHLVKRLEQHGLILVERFSAHRIVTVLATGKKTAEPNHPGHRKQHEYALRRRDELAELVANGATLVEASRVMGFSPKRAIQMWAEIRKPFGWQAR